ncbi:hypothetical protein QL285_082891 [Trifolium repens]|nr:hypothetical protein QL285_082891 [Trifolium repens]
MTTFPIICLRVSLLLPSSTNFHHLPFVNMNLNVIFPISCFYKSLMSHKFSLIKPFTLKVCPISDQCWCNGVRRPGFGSEPGCPGPASEKLGPQKKFI